jgi:hypothetical protein
MKMKSVMVLMVGTLMLGLALGGCGFAAVGSSRQTMDASRDQLKACLAQNPANPTACQGAWVIYQADLAAFRENVRSIQGAQGLSCTYGYGLMSCY